MKHWKSEIVTKLKSKKIPKKMSHTHKRTNIYIRALSIYKKKINISRPLVQCTVHASISFDEIRPVWFVITSSTQQSVELVYFQLNRIVSLYLLLILYHIFSTSSFPTILAFLFKTLDEMKIFEEFSGEQKSFSAINYCYVIEFALFEKKNTPKFKS